MRAVGFNVAAYCARRGEPKSLASLYVVVRVSLDVVYLQRVEGHATQTDVVNIDDFLRSFEPRDIKECEKVCTGWPAKVPCVAESYVKAIMQGRCLNALHGAARYAESLCPLAEHLKVVAQPKRSVFVTKFVPPGGLVLVPETTKIAAKAVGDIPLDAVRLIVQNGNLDPKVEYVAEPQFAETTFVSPAWAVRKAEQSEDVNMKWGWLQQSLVAVAETHDAPNCPKITWSKAPDAAAAAAEPSRGASGEAAAAKAGVRVLSKQGPATPATPAMSAPVAGGGRDSTEVKILVPVLVNIAPLNEGAELFVPNLKKKKKKKAPEGAHAIDTKALLRASKKPRV